jgi:hypothetical protein
VRDAILVAAALLLLTSCSTLQADPIPAEFRRPELRYFVENHGLDRRHLDRLIAMELRHRGLDALPAPPRTRRDDFEILVTYEDRWTWDWSTYLTHMRIDVRDAKTNVLIASGSAYRSGYSRRPPRSVIRSIVEELLR